MRFSNFGAGTLTTDASGNLSVSSDERLKNIRRCIHSRPLRHREALPRQLPLERHLRPRHEHAIRGLLRAERAARHPRSRRPDSHGYLTLQDRPLIATVVNAIKELAAITGTFKSHARRVARQRRQRY